MNKELSDLGIGIKNARIEMSLSQEQLADKCSIERSQLCKIEQGQINGVQFLTIQKILNALNLRLIIDKEEKQLALHPFVKWAGGKTQLLKQITELMPKEYNDYYEPFVGGGALLFKVQPKSFYINDVNKELINAYKCFLNKTKFEDLKRLLEAHEKKHSEEYFYKVRNADRDGKIKKYTAAELAARLIYVNKACFNGLYRVNSKGIFNVPSGKKKTVNAFDRVVYENLYGFFKNSDSHITSCDFEEAVSTAKTNDFVYFDPPYDVLKKTTFTTYDVSTFKTEEQKRLANCFKDLTKRGVKVMLSNHDTPLIRDLYKDFKIVQVHARRSINSKGNQRQGVNEVLVMNY